MAAQQERIGLLDIWANLIVTGGKSLQTNGSNGVIGFDVIGVRLVHMRRFL
jgi:hypothetical protein